MSIILIILLVIIIIIVAAVILLYNGLVSSRNRVKNSWAQIEVQLNRRADLIPNLVETVNCRISSQTLKTRSLIQDNSTMILF